jgi:site-specific DNA-methyltransferase (cytosine-N4-specific)
MFPSESIDLIVFSPPYYGLRYYTDEADVVWDDGWFGQLGLEPSPDTYVEHMLQVFGELKRVLKKTGSIYIIIGDTYSGSNCGAQHGWADYKRSRVKGIMKDVSPQSKVSIPRKSLIGIPWRLALRCIDELGLILRNAIIWYKPNGMPSSAKDRLSTSYEFIFHFVKSPKYYYNLNYIRVPPSSLDINERKHYLIVRLYELAKKFRASSNYKGKNREIDGWTEVLRNLKAYRLALKMLIKLEKLTDDEIQFLNDYVQNHVSHPHGRNPGDVFYVKHDVAVGRIGNFSYTDPIHTRGYHPLGKNPGDLWKINTRPFKDVHFAVYPVDLVLYPILSSCPPNGIVLDPFFGAGTTALAVEYINHGMWDKFRLYVNPLAKKQKWNIKWIGIEIVKEYCEIAKKRLELEIPKKINVPSPEVLD